MAGGKGRADVPAAYEGREHAFIKHQLLRAYLEKLFLIIGMRLFRGAVVYRQRESDGHLDRRFSADPRQVQKGARKTQRNVAVSLLVR